ncbi:MAG: hypothetical protein ACPGVI_04220 [Crocinitomicaceae bacterium]
MNKLHIKEKLFEQQENIIRELAEKVEMTHSMVDVDEDDTHDPDDYSHQYESGEMEQLIKVQLNKAKGNMERLKTIDFGEKDTVTPGALVQTPRFNFFIGFATVPFHVDGKHIVGISTESPIYSIMNGRKEGDKFSFSGINYEISKIN